MKRIPFRYALCAVGALLTVWATDTLAEEAPPAALGPAAPAAAAVVITPVVPVATTPAPAPVPTVEVAPAPATPEAAPAPIQADAPAAGDDRLIIEYVEADIQNVLRTMASRAGLNLILGEEVIGKVTVHLEGVEYEDAMRLIAESKGFAFVKDKNVIKVKSKESLEAEPVELLVLNLNYAKAEDVKKIVDPMLTARGKVQIDVRSNTLIISDTPSNLAKIKPMVQSLDTQTPQVMIEAKFVETTRSPTKDLGINWTDTLLNHKFTAGPFNLTKDLSGGPWIPSTAVFNAGFASILFSYMSKDAHTELLANPRIVTTDNGKAKIAIATQYPIPNFEFSEQTASLQISGFTYKDIGIILNVTPRINKNEFITLEVAPEASSSTESATLQSGGGTAVEIPIINTRTATTTVLIKSGHTLAIGGLMRVDVDNRYTKVPIMGDLPGLGAFFRSKSLLKIKRDLLIFLTPTIVGPEGQTGYENQYGGMHNPEVYTDDTWMPQDGAQPRPWAKPAFLKNWSQSAPGAAPAAATPAPTTPAPEQPTAPATNFSPKEH